MLRTNTKSYSIRKREFNQILEYVPKVCLLEVDLPEVDLPEVGLPEVGSPEVRLPEVAIKQSSNDSRIAKKLAIKSGIIQLKKK